MDKGRTLYDVLEIPHTASLEDIRKAYRRLAMKWHPDRNPKKQKQAELKFKEISHAYHVLSEQVRRHHYDETLDGQPIPPSETEPFDKAETNEDVSNTFLAMVLDISFGMAAQGYSEREIFNRLVEEGCPERIAALVARRAGGNQRNVLSSLTLPPRKIMALVGGLVSAAILLMLVLFSEDEDEPYTVPSTLNPPASAPPPPPANKAEPAPISTPAVNTAKPLVPPVDESAAITHNKLAEVQWNMPVTLTGDVMSGTYMDCCLGGLPNKTVYHYLLLDSPIEMKGGSELQMTPNLPSVTKVQLSADIFDLMEAAETQHATIACREIRHGGNGHYALPVYCEVDHIGDNRKFVVTEKNELDLEGRNAYEISILPGAWFSRKMAYLNQELNEEFLHGLKVSGKVTKLPHYTFGAGCSVEGCEKGSSVFVIDGKTRELSSIYGKDGLAVWAKGFLAEGIPQQLCEDLSKLERLPKEVFFCPRPAN